MLWGEDVSLFFFILNQKLGISYLYEGIYNFMLLCIQRQICYFVNNLFNQLF